MTDYFIWNGVDCRTKGIHVSELPPITIPLERSKQTNVPGRPGSLTQLEGDDVYDDMSLTATCFIADPAQIPVIAAWLKGKGKEAVKPPRPNHEFGPQRIWRYPRSVLPPVH